MIKVNNENTRPTSLNYRALNFEHFTPFSVASIVDFKQVNVFRVHGIPNLGRSNCGYGVIFSRLMNNIEYEPKFNVSTDTAHTKTIRSVNSLVPGFH